MSYITSTLIYGCMASEHDQIFFLVFFVFVVIVVMDNIIDVIFVVVDMVVVNVEQVVERVVDSQLVPQWPLADTEHNMSNLFLLQQQSHYFPLYLLPIGYIWLIYHTGCTSSILNFAQLDHVLYSLVGENQIRKS